MSDDRTRRARAGLGVGKCIGPRPEKFKTSKGELEQIIRRLKTCGFGNDFIGEWTGYSASTIANYSRDFQIPSVSMGQRAWRIFEILPDELKRELTRIRIKSQIAHEKALNRLSATRAVHTHILVDEDETSCVNNGGTVRPEKAAA